LLVVSFFFNSSTQQLTRVTSKKVARQHPRCDQQRSVHRYMYFEGSECCDCTPGCVGRPCFCAELAVIASVLTRKGSTSPAIFAWNVDKYSDKNSDVLRLRQLIAVGTLQLELRGRILRHGLHTGAPNPNINDSESGPLYTPQRVSTCICMCKAGKQGCMLRIYSCRPCWDVWLALGPSLHLLSTGVFGRSGLVLDLHAYWTCAMHRVAAP